ncbi:MAG: reverse transcriptase-like protein [Anaerolineaceae bacterium]|nr:reverse transcriptase-like protein [Anaerolineaceae bacterium]
MAVRRKILIYIDGGSRGNPGPAACAAVLKSADDGQTVLEKARFLGQATNNVAEYEGLLLGLRLAADLRATQIEVRSDSELLVRQMSGRYRVRSAGLQKLHRLATEALDAFSSVEIGHIPRDENAEADALLNKALDKHLKDHKGGGSRKGTTGPGRAFRIK